MAGKYESEASKGSEPWSRTSNAYNSTVARPTKEGCLALMERAHARQPFDAPGTKVIDLGAGTGMFVLNLSLRFPQVPITATDISESMLSQLRDARRAHLEELGKSEKDDRVTVRTLDIHDPCGVEGEKEGTYTHAVSTYVMEIILDPQAAIEGMFKLLRSNSGSIAAVGCWDFSRQFDPHAIWEESAVAVDPNYHAPPRNITNNWNSREDMEDIMRSAGFIDVEGVFLKVKFVTDQPVESFMNFFWKSQNPMTVERKRSWKGDLEPVKRAMRRIVDERVSSGRGIWASMGLIIGSKP